VTRAKSSRNLMTTELGVVELWGCGFNDFNQIDSSDDDVHTLKLIDSREQACPQDLLVLWAGWGDLFCT